MDKDNTLLSESDHCYCYQPSSLRKEKMSMPEEFSRSNIVSSSPQSQVACTTPWESIAQVCFSLVSIHRPRMLPHELCVPWDLQSLLLHDELLLLLLSYHSSSCGRDLQHELLLIKWLRHESMSHAPPATSTPSTLVINQQEYTSFLFTLVGIGEAQAWGLRIPKWHVAPTSQLWNEWLPNKKEEMGWCATAACMLPPCLPRGEKKHRLPFPFGWLVHGHGQDVCAVQCRYEWTLLASNKLFRTCFHDKLGGANYYYFSPKHGWIGERAWETELKRGWYVGTN